jgi:hypothetical protein
VATDSFGPMKLMRTFFAPVKALIVSLIVGVPLFPPHRGFSAVSGPGALIKIKCSVPGTHSVTR